jgi:hypothetical protein
LGKVSLSDGGNRTRDLGGWTKQILNQCVYRNFDISPSSSRFMKAEPFARSSLFADDLPDTLQFLGHLLVGSDDGIESIGNLSLDPGPGTWQPDGKIAVSHGLEAGQNRD